MLVTYGEYVDMGYSNVGAAEFKKYSVAAERTIVRLTFGRVGKDSITKEGKYGVCEVIDILHEEAAPRLESFTNEGYQERYSESGSPTAMERVEHVVNTYFGRGDVFRGVDGRGGKR